MDPVAAIDSIQTLEASPERAWAVEGLREWMSAGGFLPTITDPYGNACELVGVSLTPDDRFRVRYPDGAVHHTPQVIVIAVGGAR